VSRQRRHRVPRDTGAATVWVLALAVLLAAAGGLVLVLGAVSAGRYRAATAADQAALAAAAAQVRADADPCGVAARVSAAGGAALVGCTLLGDGVVDVTVRLSRVLPWPGLDVRARSRAGPSGPSG
jgi:secretion/DNA translocation related TadE-like protein